MRIILALVISLAGGIQVVADERRPDAAQWVEDLGDDDYQVRETATHHLRDTGLAALSVLVAAMDDEDPEVRTRAFGLLVRLYCEGDYTSHYAAQKELKKLATSQHVLAERARTALQEEPVLTWILRNGGLCELDPEAAEISIVTVKLDRTRGVDPLFYRDQLHDYDYVRLSELPELRSLTLENRHALTDEGLRWIARFRNLRALNLSGTHLRGSGLRHLAELPRLEALYLNNCRRFELQHYALLPALSTLEVLHAVASVDGWQNDDLWARSLQGVVSSNAQLVRHGTHQLAEYRGGIGDEQLVHIGKLFHLRELVLKKTLITDDGLEALTPLTDLQLLDLSRTRVTNLGLQRIAALLPSLRVLKLNFVPVTDEGLSHLTQLAHLEELELRGVPLTGRGLKTLAGLPRLRRLDLSLTRVDDEATKGLVQLETLESLDLTFTKITAQGVKELSGLPNLRHLALKRTPISDEVIPPLAACPALQSVDLREAKLTFAGAVRLAECADGIDLQEAVFAAGIAEYDDDGDIVYLNLQGRKVRDDDLQIVSRFHKLRYLRLADTDISNAGLSLLKNCTALVSLTVDNTRTTNEALKHLKPLVHLNTLSARNTGITADAVFALIMSQGRGEQTALKVAGLAE